MRTFARKKKGSHLNGTDATATPAEVVNGLAPVGSLAPAPAVELRTRHYVRQSPARSAEPDPYAFDICDDADAPGEGSQHDPAFLESLVARTNSSLSDDGRLASASPPERRAGQGPPHTKAPWATGRSLGPGDAAAQRGLDEALEVPELDGAAHAAVPSPEARRPPQQQLPTGFRQRAQSAAIALFKRAGGRASGTRSQELESITAEADAPRAPSAGERPRSASQPDPLPDQADVDTMVGRRSASQGTGEDGGAAEPAAKRRRTSEDWDEGIKKQKMPNGGRLPAPSRLASADRSNSDASALGSQEPDGEPPLLVRHGSSLGRRRNGTTGAGPKGSSGGRRMLSGDGGAAPITSLIEAQESGEHRQLLDAAWYALDGLQPAACEVVQCDSALTFAEMAATARGRLALRSDGILQEALGKAAALPLQQRPTLALVLAALLASFSRQAADQTVLATPESATLLREIILVEDEADVALPSGARAAKLAQAACSPMPDQLCKSPRLIALHVLAGATDPHRSPSTADALKDSLRASGLLDLLVRRTRDALAACCGSQDDADTDAVSRTSVELQALLLILENATFACPANEAHLISPALASAPFPEEDGYVSPRVKFRERLTGAASTSATHSGQPFCAWLVEQLADMHQAVIEGSMSRECLHSALAVLMNVAHNSVAGRAVVEEAGAVDAAAQLLAVVALPFLQQPGGVQQAPDAQALSHVLGLLINLVEDSTDNRKQLISFAGRQQGAETGGGALQGIIAMLCQLVTLSPGEDGTPRTSMPTQHLDEVTAEQLERSEVAGAASILEVYAATLCGFLVVADVDLRKEAAALLRGHSLEPLVSAIQRMLHFYVNTGTIVQQAEARLRELVNALSSGAAAGQVQSSSVLA